MTLDDRIAWRPLVADTFSMVTFSWVVGGAMELCSGMSLEQCVRSRAAMTVVNLLSGRPYGLFRDYCLRRCHVDESSSPVTKAVVDICANVSFSIPLYAGQAYLVAGLDGEQLLTSTAAIAGLVIVGGRPFGWYLEKVRDWLNVPKETD